MTIRQSIVQVNTPNNLLSRVQSFRLLSDVGANFVGQTELASLSGVMGASKTILLGGIVYLLVG